MKKKILIFHPALAPYRIDQFNTLNELFDVEVVFLYKNLWTYKLDQNRLLSHCNFKYSFLLIGPRYKGRVFRLGMYNKIRISKPDIILGYEYSFTTQYLLLLKRLKLINQKVGSTIDDSIDICHNIQSRTRYQARKRTVNKLDYLVVLSNEVSQYYQDVFNLKSHQIIISPILQKPERLRSNEIMIEKLAVLYEQKYNLYDKKVLLFVGRLIPEKGLPEFINTIHTVLQTTSSLVFVAVGEGNEITQLRALVDKYKLNDKVIFPGKFEDHELYAWYLCGSGFVLPSFSETFGAVVNEALIFGLKVLCSKYAGAKCLIHSDNGMVFDPKDEIDTLSKLNEFLKIMKPINELRLSNKPSLMNEDNYDFINEWEKVLYD